MKSTASRWNPELHLLHTELKGKVDEQDVQVWCRGLSEAVSLIPSNGRFRLLLDLTTFEAESLQAHQAMRTVIPELQASHGMRPSFVDLFDEKMEVPLTLNRGVRCVGFANVHHDPVKMGRYEAQIAKPDQRFFIDVVEAEAWLKSLPVTVA